MSDYTLPYGNVLAVRIMLIIILVLIPVFCAYMIAKAIYTADQSENGNIEIVSGFVGIIGSLIMAIVLIVSGVL